MTREQFNQVVEEAIGLLPQEVREALSNLAVIVEDRPAYETLREVGLGPNDILFGLFQGVPITQNSFFSPGAQLPNRITLFKEELEEVCRTEEELTRGIIMTLAHEVGHYLGLGERELRQLEAEVGRRGRV
jgi:predicted Zn-dependent protease with MMP-like domain